MEDVYFSLAVSKDEIFVVGSCREDGGGVLTVDRLSLMGKDSDSLCFLMLHDQIFVAVIKNL